MKIGCVPYGHAKPLAQAWAGQAPTWAHPRELAQKLWAGQLDLALVPIWEVLRRPGTRVLDGVAIGSRGEVRSVGVFFEKNLEECRSIRLTPHSVTSVQLWKLIAAHRQIYLPESPEGEARLLIGDEARAAWSQKQGRGILDLGQAWTEWTGKPFVFAVWALGIRAQVSPKRLDSFRQACLQGIRDRGEFAEDAEEREYLTRCIRYGLGPEEKAGMEEFARRSGLERMQIDWV